jgi:hypothetical protein
MTFAAIEAREVTRSSKSAASIASIPRLAPTKRSGSGSQSGEWWPTHGRVVS